jgi:molybdenum cofactor synthesis domain-containing protein
VIPLDEARRTVAQGCPPPKVERVPLAEVLGCVLAAPAAARVDVPPFANSAMDGYAVRAADVAAAPVTLEVVGRVLAGASLGSAVGPGPAARLRTGAPGPEGADAVCMVERTRPAPAEDGSGGAAPEEAARVVVEAPVAPGENVRRPGGDVRAGETVLGEGAVVGPVQLAALISAGCAEVSAYPRLRVGVVSTGDELVDIGRPLGAAQIYDSNRPMLLGLVQEAGCVAVDLGRVGDDEDLLAARITGALGEVDALVLSGGVSVGDVDVVRMVLERLGAGEDRWMQIAIRPAKPFAFVTLPGSGGPVPTFGLPGNPVSSAVSFELLVRPALRRMAGQPVTDRPRCTALAAEPLERRPDGRVHFVRVALERSGGEPSRRGHGGDAGPTEWLARPCPGQGSHQIRSMAISDGLAVVADGHGVGAGEPVEVILTGPVASSWATCGPAPFGWAPSGPAGSGWAGGGS